MNERDKNLRREALRKMFDQSTQVWEVCVICGQGRYAPDFILPETWVGQKDADLFVCGDCARARGLL